MLSPLAFGLYAFLLGLLLGSFLNVCVSRLPQHRSISKPRSHCSKCLVTIRWYDNIPLLSWILIRGKCRHCKEPISWRYPAVELGYAVWFLVAFRLLQFGFIAYEQFGQPIDLWLWPSLTWMILGFLLIGLTVMDWQTHTLPDAFTLTGTAIGFFLVCVQAIFLGPGEDAIKITPAPRPTPLVAGLIRGEGQRLSHRPRASRLWPTARHRWRSAAAARHPLAVLPSARQASPAGPCWRRSGHPLWPGPWRCEAAGDDRCISRLLAGDPRAGAWLRHHVGVWASVLLARRNATGSTQIPFGSFLSLGGLIAALFGAPIIAWYSSLL